jgi:hypothetical protein
MKMYVKRNMGLTIIVTLILISGVAMFAHNLRTARAGTVVPIGNDTFSTGTGSQAQFSFAAGDFGPGSQAFTTSVTMVSNAYPDTVIHRDSAIAVPGTSNLTLQTLSMRGSSAIAVPFSDGSIRYGYISTAPDSSTPSAGTMNLTGEGTGNVTLNIHYVLNVTCGSYSGTKGGQSISFGTCSINGWTCSGGTFCLPPQLPHQAAFDAHVVQVIGG